MKKKSRTIIVGDRKYGYVVAPDRARAEYPGFLRITIWNLDCKHGQKLKTYIRFDDPWLNYGPLITGEPDKIKEAFELRPVTPKVIGKIIDMAIITGWEPTKAGKEIIFDWDRKSEQLIHTSNSSFSGMR